MKVLVFNFRGDLYFVNEQGQISKNSPSNFSETWIFLGGSKHHWSSHINVTLNDAFYDPKLLNECLGWDIDHGTTRQWGGSYFGKLPRISGAYTCII